MKTKTYQLEFTHSTTDIYYISAKNEEEAKKKFFSGECGEPDESIDNEDDDEIEIEEFDEDDEAFY